MSFRTVFILESIPQYKELLIYFKDRPFITHIPSVFNSFVVDYVTEEDLKYFSEKGFEYLTWDYEELDKDIKEKLPHGLKGGEMDYPLPKQTDSNFFDYSKTKEIRDNLWVLKTITVKGDIERIIGDKSLEEATDFEIEQILLFSEVVFHIPGDFEFNNDWPRKREEYPNYILSSIEGVWSKYAGTRPLDILTAVTRLRLKDLEEAVEKCVCHPKEDPLPVAISTQDKIPVRTELTVIPADREWKHTIGFTIYEIPSYEYNSKTYTSNNGSLYEITYWGSCSSIINKSAMDAIQVAR